VVIQSFGLFAVLAGLGLLVSPWVLIVAGAVALVAPELVGTVKR
jgi:hypothetical protein